MKKNFFIKKISNNIAIAIARIAQLVEHDLAKVGVAGSSPVSRSLFLKYKVYQNVARMAELVDAQDLKSCDQ